MNHRSLGTRGLRFGALASGTMAFGDAFGDAFGEVGPRGAHAAAARMRLDVHGVRS